MADGKTKAEIEVPPVVLPEDMDDEEKGATREIAEFEAKTALHLRDTLVSEGLASMRWVQASLLLVNGGGAAAVLSTVAIPAAARSTAGAFFVGGIAMSLFASLLGNWLVRDAPRKLSEIAGYWISVKHDLLRVASWERDFIAWSKGVGKRGRWVYLPGSLAFLAFLTGAAVLGCGILHAPSP